MGSGRACLVGFEFQTHSSSAANLARSRNFFALLHGYLRPGYIPSSYYNSDNNGNGLWSKGSSSSQLLWQSFFCRIHLKQKESDNILSCLIATNFINWQQSLSQLTNRSLLNGDQISFSLTLAFRVIGTFCSNFSYKFSYT